MGLVIWLWLGPEDTFKITLDMDDIIDLVLLKKVKKKKIKLQFNRLKKSLNSLELLDYQLIDILNDRFCHWGGTW